MTYSIAAYVIPSAIRRTDGKVAVTATLSLRPVAGSAEDDLADWPTRIKAALANPRAVTVKARAAGTTSDRSGAVRSLFAGRYEKAKLGADPIAKITALWQALLSDADKTFAGLEAALLTEPEAPFFNIERKPVPTGTGTAQPSGGAAADPPHPDILSVPRNDLSHLFTLNRARSIAETAGGKATPRPAASLEHDLGDWFERPWSRLPTALERLALAHSATPAWGVAAAGFAPDGTPVTFANGVAAGPSVGLAYDPYRYTANVPTKDMEHLKKALISERRDLDDMLKTKLAKDRERTDCITRAARDVTNRSDALKDMKALRGKARLGLEGARDAIRGAGRGVQELTERMAVHHAAGLDDYGPSPMQKDCEEPEPAKDPKRESAERRWFALQGLPSLQRLLHVAIDVELIWTETDFPSAQQPDASSFVEIGMSFGQGPTLYTLCRVTLPPTADTSGRGACWPVTLEERLEAERANPAQRDKLRERATIDQFDGILDLEAFAPNGSVRVSRFDVDSLDVVAAAETEMNRDRAKMHAEQESQAVLTGGGTVGRNAQKSAAADRKLRTAGIRLVDQWSTSVAVKEFTRAFDAAPGPGGALGNQVLDADDLTVGFKLDVAVRADAKGARLWTSLTDRKVTFALPPSIVTRASWPKSVTLETAIDAFVGGDSEAETRARRRRLDGVSLNAPARILQNASSNTAFAEPILATWEGDPLALECREDATKVEAQDLPISLTFDLDKMGSHRPNRLRFGAAYWFGARAVMLGGAGHSLEGAQSYYEKGLSPGAQGMAMPALPSQVRRHLRFEWVDGPMVAVPWGDIQTEFAIREGLDGASMVVRSQPAPAAGDGDPEDGRRFGPNRTRRVLFAPAVDLTFAHLHGVFDDLPLKSEEQPPCGLRGICYDRKLGGFPSFVPGAPVSEASITHAAVDAGGNPLPAGLAIFRKAGSGFVAEDGYRPDPAARQLVIALRRGNDGPYLAGAPIVVELYPDHVGHAGPATPGYPHAVPILVTVLTHPAEKKPEPLTNDLLLKRTGRTSWTRRVGLNLDPKASGLTEALEVELRLGPGEDLTLECWCVPDMAHLAAWFDAPESVALLGAGRPNGSPSDLVAAAKTLRELINLSGVAEGKPLPTKPADDKLTIRRSGSVVEIAAVRAAATALSEALRNRPVPGLAAVRRIRATHAVEKPATAPSIVPDPAWPVRLRRVGPATDPELGLTNEPWRTWTRTQNDEGGVDLLVAGATQLDPHAVERLEVHFSAVAPRARAIDDPNRGRTAEDRMRGRWCELRPSAGVSLTESLYGFHVDENGRVILKSEKVLYARWRIEPPVDGEALAIRDLLALARANELNPNDGGQSADRFFPDGTARRVRVHVAGTSRTARLIPQRSVYPDARQLQLDERRGRAVKSAAGGKRDEAETVETVLRATVRPAAVPSRSLLPAFVWPSSEKDKADKPRRVERRTRIRIRVDRPWFTSGEDERLGIVVWPPNILNAKAADVHGTHQSAVYWDEVALAQGRIARTEPLQMGDDTALIDLIGQNEAAAQDPASGSRRPDYFTDDDLGPGGAFTTRWGVDPIHEAGSLTWFVHAGAFSEEVDWRATAIDAIATEGEDSGRLWPEQDRYKPRFVENVLMPIPEREGKPEASDKLAAGKPRDVTYMMVSLVTFAPRFDVDMEQWYVDVEIDPGLAPDPFLRLGLVRFQPHANRRLQVSYPIAEWTQVPGHRRGVRLDVDAASRTATVTAEIPQLATLRKESPRTMIRATLRERRLAEDGRWTERTARRHDANGRSAEPYVQTRYPGPVASESWVATFQLPPIDHAADQVLHEILVEEVYVMPRATFAKEPHAEDPNPDKGISDTELWQETGPRFAALLRI